MNIELSVPTLRVEVVLSLAPELLAALQGIGNLIARPAAPSLVAAPREDGGGGAVGSSPQPAPVAQAGGASGSAAPPPVAAPAGKGRPAGVVGVAAVMPMSHATKAQDALLAAMRQRQHLAGDIGRVLGWSPTRVNARLGYLRRNGVPIPLLTTNGTLAEPYSGPIPDEEEMDRLLRAMQAEREQRDARVPVTMDEAVEWGRANGADVSGRVPEIIRRVQALRLAKEVPLFKITDSVRGADLVAQLRTRVAA